MRSDRSESPALVLFDMDGVLADTEPLHCRAAVAVLAREGVASTIDEIREFMGRTDTAMFEVLKERHGLPGAVARYVAGKQAALLAELSDLAPNPGVCELLLQLKLRSVPAVVASSSSLELIEAVVGALGLRSSFSGLFSASHVARGKPAPDLFLHAAQSMGVPPEHCLVIEDAPAGVAAARAAGMRVVALRTEFGAGLDLSAADAVLDSLEQFDLGVFDDR